MDSTQWRWKCGASLTVTARSTVTCRCVSLPWITISETAPISMFGRCRRISMRPRALARAGSRGSTVHQKKAGSPRRPYRPSTVFPPSGRPQ